MFPKIPSKLNKSCFYIISGLDTHKTLSTIQFFAILTIISAFT